MVVAFTPRRRPWRLPSVLLSGLLGAVSCLFVILTHSPDPLREADMIEVAANLPDFSAMAFPIPAKDFYGYTSAYGMRNHPVSGGQKMHWGIDMAAKYDNAPILAWYKGRVENVTPNPSSGCGNEITIQSGDFETRYCHCSEILVSEGQEVSTGQQIAKQGATGGVTGQHLHFEIYYKGQIFNPGYVLNLMYAQQKAAQ